MHAKYQRRVPHLEQAHFFKRTPADASGFILTGPITVTVIQTAAETPNVNKASSSKISTTSSEEASTTSTTLSPSVFPSTTTTTFLVKITESTTSSTSTPPSFAPSPPVASPSIITQNAALNSPQPLSSGAIAGVVIVCLFVLVGAVVFGMRRRFMHHRMKLRGVWTKSKAMGIPPTSPFEPQEYPGTIRPYPFPVPPSSTNNDLLTTPSSPGTYFAGAQASALASRGGPARPSMSSVLAPPVSYGSGFGSQTPGYGSTTIPTSRFSSVDAALFPFGATVICTFITSLPDELSIKVGETIRVLAEYDDGWALCLSARGEQGMVPLQCLDRGVASSSENVNVDMDGRRRVSSLNALRR